MRNTEPPDWPREGLWALLAGVAGHLPIVLAQCAVGWHPADYALVDEFGLSRSALHFFDTREIDFYGWASMTLLGLLYWALPFIGFVGHSFLSTRIAGWTLDLLGPAAFFLILRQRGASRGLAFGGAVALGWSPLYTMAAAPFMTDAPYLALCLCGVWCFERALASGTTPALNWVVAGSALFVAAGSIRQTAVLGLVAFLLAAGTRGLSRPVSLILATAATAITVLYLVARSVPGFLMMGSPLEVTPARAMEWPSAVVALAMGLWPFVTAGRWGKATLTILAALAGAWIAWARYAPGKPLGFSGTALGPGIADAVSGFPLVALGLFAIARVATSGRSWLAFRPGVLEVFALSHAAALIPMAIGRPLFDRYALPLAPLLIALCVMSLEFRRWHLTMGLAVMGGLSTLQLESSLHDKSLQWELGRAITGFGASPQDVEIDFTWAGFHARNGELWSATQTPLPKRFSVTPSPGKGDRILDRRDRARFWRPGARGRYRYFYLVEHGERSNP